MSTAEKWQQKATGYMESILGQIKAIRESLKANRRKKNKQEGAENYRGKEHGWYAVWNAMLVKLCEKSDTLLPCPQHWVHRVLLDQGENTVDQWLIPDFLLIRVSRHEGRYNRVVVKTKVVVLFEIKATPGIDSTPDEVWDALLKGRSQLGLQTRLFFAGLNTRRENKKVVGIYAAGEYWTWEVLTPDNLGVKPLSKNADPLYRGSEEPEVPPVQHPERYYKLNTRESDAAMNEMLEEIFKLPGSQIFGDLR